MQRELLVGLGWQPLMLTPQLGTKTSLWLPGCSAGAFPVAGNIERPRRPQAGDPHGGVREEREKRISLAHKH